MTAATPKISGIAFSAFSDQCQDKGEDSGNEESALPVPHEPEQRNTLIADVHRLESALVWIRRGAAPALCDLGLIQNLNLILIRICICIFARVRATNVPNAVCGTAHKALQKGSPRVTAARRGIGVIWSPRGIFSKTFSHRLPVAGVSYD
jgi:hypothetical protein